jgi:hypothetical protein
MCLTTPSPFKSEQVFDLGEPASPTEVYIYPFNCSYFIHPIDPSIIEEYKPFPMAMVLYKKKSNECGYRFLSNLSCSKC